MSPCKNFNPGQGTSTPSSSIHEATSKAKTLLQGEAIKSNTQEVEASNGNKTPTLPMVTVLKIWNEYMNPELVKIIEEFKEITTIQKGMRRALSCKGNKLVYMTKNLKKQIQL